MANTTQGQRYLGLWPPKKGMLDEQKMHELVAVQQKTDRELVAVQSAAIRDVDHLKRENEKEDLFFQLSAQADGNHRGAGSNRSAASERSR